MKRLKYNECYCTTDNRFHEIEFFANLSIKELAAFKGKIFCPECKKAILTVVESKHFRGIPTSPHDDNCSERITKKEYETINNICESNDEIEIERVEKQIKNLFNAKVKSDALIIHESAASFIDTNKSTREDVLNKARVNTYLIPHKHLERRFNENDYGNYKIFHGRVKFKKRRYKTGFFYDLYIEKSKRSLCSIAISDKIHQYFDDETKNKLNSEEQYFNIIFVANMESKGDFNNCTLRRSTYIKIYY